MKKINEIFYSLQGEGYHTGIPAIFVRFSGCNMKCSFCDTLHEDGIMMSDEEIISEVVKYPASMVVLTGAVLLMVDSNLQRENILPSERAFAYKMKLEALKNQGARSDLTSVQVAPKLSTEKIGEEVGMSKDNVKRYIRLTNLIPELLDMVDEKKIAFNPAVELSYLDEAQQRDFLEAMNDTQNAPSLSQAQRLKKLAQEGHFSYDVAFAVMGEEKKDELDKVVIKNDTLRKYFPRSYTPKQMEDTIIKLLEQWQRKQQRQNER